MIWRSPEEVAKDLDAKYSSHIITKRDSRGVDIGWMDCLDLPYAHARPLQGIYWCISGMGTGRYVCVNVKGSLGTETKDTCCCYVSHLGREMVEYFWHCCEVNSNSGRKESQECEQECCLMLPHNKSLLPSFASSTWAGVTGRDRSKCSPTFIDHMHYSYLYFY